MLLVACCPWALIHLFPVCAYPIHVFAIPRPIFQGSTWPTFVKGGYYTINGSDPLNMTQFDQKKVCVRRFFLLSSPSDISLSAPHDSIFGPLHTVDALCVDDSALL